MDKKNRSWKTMVLITIVVILGFLSTFFISYQANGTRSHKDIESMAILSSDGIYDKLETILTKPINISTTMAHDYFLKEQLSKEKAHLDDPAYVERIAAYLLEIKETYGYESTFLISTASQRYYHFDGIDRLMEEGDEENLWYEKFLSEQKVYDMNIDNDQAANNEITIFVNAAIKDEKGILIGIIGVGVKIDNLQQLLKDYETHSNATTYLVNPKGEIQISANHSGFQTVSLFDEAPFGSLDNQIISDPNNIQKQWYEVGNQKNYIISRFIEPLGWYMVTNYDASGVQTSFFYQFVGGVFILIMVIVVVLGLIAMIIRKDNKRMLELTSLRNNHRELFQQETNQLYENIYEIDITHNCAASEATEDYFKSLGVPEHTPYQDALSIIAKQQIKKEYRDGYISTFSRKNVLASFAQGIRTLQYEFMITHDGIHYYWMRITTRIFEWQEDGSIRMFVYRQNIDEQKRQETQLQESLKHDFLSGLYNKATTQELIAHQLLYVQQNRFAFLIIDIDSFKQVNDTYGHQFGDAVIKDFAQHLKARATKTDIIGRIGGDEFVVFLSIANETELTEITNGILHNLHYTFVEDGIACPISASIGVAMTPEAGTTFDELYRNADQALYASKRKGRHCFSIFHP